MSGEGWGAGGAGGSVITVGHRDKTVGRLRFMHHDVSFFRLRKSAIAWVTFSLHRGAVRGCPGSELPKTEAFGQTWGAMLPLKGGGAAIGGFGPKVPDGHSLAMREPGWAGRGVGDPAGATCRTRAGTCLKGVGGSAPPCGACSPGAEKASTAKAVPRWRGEEAGPERGRGRVTVPPGGAGGAAFSGQQAAETPFSFFQSVSVKDGQIARCPSPSRLPRPLGLLSVLRAAGGGSG